VAPPQTESSSVHLGHCRAVSDDDRTHYHGRKDSTDRPRIGAPATANSLTASRKGGVFCRYRKQRGEFWTKLMPWCAILWINSDARDEYCIRGYHN